MRESRNASLLLRTIDKRPLIGDAELIGIDIAIQEVSTESPEVIVCTAAGYSCFPVYHHQIDLRDRHAGFFGVLFTRVADRPSWIPILNSHNVCPQPTPHNFIIPFAIGDLSSISGEFDKNREPAPCSPLGPRIPFSYRESHSHLQSVTKLVRTRS